MVTPRPPQRWWAVAATVVAFAVICTVVLAGMLPAGLVTSKTSEIQMCAGRGSEATPYARVPGSAQPVGERVHVDASDVTRYPAASPFHFVTISEPAQTVLSRLVAPSGPLILWMTECEKFGDQTPQERRQRSLQMMATSEDVAKYVALRSLGFDAELVPAGVMVRNVMCLEPSDDGCAEFTPASSVLEVGDFVRAADGQEVASVADLVEVLATKDPGDVVELRLDRDEETVTETVELIPHPTEPDRVIVGFEADEPIEGVDLPFEIGIDTGAIGGPSAGLAFTLTIIDELSPGELTGDNTVAVTGTISLDGGVGVIGGLPQKVEAARHAGVDVFLVPAGQPVDELDAARDIAASSVEIVPVSTLEEAVDALVERGGEPVELQPLTE